MLCFFLLRTQTTPEPSVFLKSCTTTRCCPACRQGSSARSAVKLLAEKPLPLNQVAGEQIKVPLRQGGASVNAKLRTKCLFFLPAEVILATAPELEDVHVVCILDLCHLGGDEVEILINRVYKVTEVSLG